MQQKRPSIAAGLLLPCVWVIVVFATVAPRARAQVACLQTGLAAKAIQAVARDHAGSNILSASHLTAAPIPALAEDAIFLETNGTPAVGMHITPYCFYSVGISPYAVKSNRVDSIAVQLDSASQWTVAIDLGSEKAYLLAGAGEPTRGFNDLVGEMHLRVTDREFALSLFDSYLRMAKGEGFRNAVVTDDMKLETLAVADFRSRFPQAKSRAEFERWWTALPRSLRTQLRTPQAAELNGRFRVRYFTYESGTLWGRSLTIDQSGAVNEEQPAVRFQGSASPRR